MCPWNLHLFSLSLIHGILLSHFLLLVFNDAFSQISRSFQPLQCRQASAKLPTRVVQFYVSEVNASKICLETTTQCFSYLLCWDTWQCYCLGIACSVVHDCQDVSLTRRRQGLSVQRCPRQSSGAVRWSPASSGEVLWVCSREPFG